MQAPDRRGWAQSAEIVEGYTNTAPFERRHRDPAELSSWRALPFARPAWEMFDPIVTIVATKTMVVLIHVPDGDVPYLDEGDRVTVRIDALGARGVYKGRIARTAYARSPGSQPPRRDRSAQRRRPSPVRTVRRVEIDLETRENVLTIPSSAIIERNGVGTAVCYRVVAGRAARSRFRVGRDDGLRAEVLEGLKEGEVVIAKPDVRMPDGQPVTIRRERNEPPGR